MSEVKKQIGQMAEFMGQFREEGKLPSSTIVNPKGGFETAKAIILRSGKGIGTNPKMSKQSPTENEKLLFKEKEEDKATAREEQPLPQSPKALTQPNLGKVVPNSTHSNPIPPNVPFPRRFMQSKKEENEKDILETFRKVQVNIPLLDTIKQVPKYAKFLKELCTTRRRNSNKEVVRVSENVSAVLQRKLPPKCKDPGSFTIPCVIGNTNRWRSGWKKNRAKLVIKIQTLPEKPLEEWLEEEQSQHEIWEEEVGVCIKPENPTKPPEPDRQRWFAWSASGIVKHGGVTPINLGKSRPLL
ncbi:unnamed protein product [Prunus brigantina]